MFEGAPEGSLSEEELLRREKEKNNGFPSDKLGENEEVVRQTFEKLLPSETYSMLLSLLARRIERKDGPQVLREYSKNELVELSPIALKDYLEMDSLLVGELGDEYETVSLSPLAPAGASSVVNRIDPKTILQTIKNTELVSDASVVLALEAARRRKEKPLKTNLSVVRLATSQREVRMQKFNNADFTPHYASFTLGTASRDTGRFDFEKRMMSEHIDYFLNALENAGKLPGYGLDGISVEISDISLLEKLVEHGAVDRMKIAKSLRESGSPDYFSDLAIGMPKRTATMEGIEAGPDFPFINVPVQVLKKFEKDYLPALKQKYPSVDFVFRLDRSAGMGYFDGLCYKIRAKNREGEVVPLVDGGSSDWNRKLLSDPGERFFGSGLGTDILIKKFKHADGRTRIDGEDIK